jgi:ribosomal protein L37AE/L43A
MTNYVNGQPVPEAETIETVEVSIKEQRLDICKSCSQYEVNRWGAGMCNECGCVIKWKASLRGQNCPIGKW